MTLSNSSIQEITWPKVFDANLGISLGVSLMNYMYNPAYQDGYPQDKQKTKTTSSGKIY